MKPPIKNVTGNKIGPDLIPNCFLIKYSVDDQRINQISRAERRVNTELGIVNTFSG
jgi:hypothetical protein